MKEFIENHDADTEESFQGDEESTMIRDHDQDIENAIEQDSENTVEDEKEDSPEKKSSCEKKNQSTVEKIAVGLFDYVETVAFTLAAVVIAFIFIFAQCRVDGPSMENTLHDGDRLIISDFLYEPQHGDIIVFHKTTSKVDRFNEPIIKRVIATAGDEVYIDFNSWTLFVNGEVVEEDYKTLKGFKTLTSDFSFPLTVPEGHIFVMGDNRNNSSDSRSDDIGFIDERSVLGRVILRISPLSDFGIVN